jgi:methylthioribose-1-phosphate isomerase
MRTVDWSGDEIVLLDQTTLPQRETTLRISTVDALVDAISRLAVRGAMALGVAGALGVALAAVRAQASGDDLDAAIDDAARRLLAARPTAVNLKWGVDRALGARADGADAILAEALAIRDEDVETNRRIGERVADYFGARRTLLTHCNAGSLAGVEWGSAIAGLRVLYERGQLGEVLVSETRPLLQGSRLTAWELERAGIPYFIIVDGAAATLIAARRVDGVVVGADRIAANGDVANKIGTLSHALAARHAGIPFVVAAPESTIDPDTSEGASIPIEERDGAEVLEFRGTSCAPAGARAINPAFDVTPAAMITALVTERRTLSPASGQAPYPVDGGG